MSTMKYEKIAMRFSDILSRNDMSARELAERSGVSESSISQYVNGSHKPSNINAGKIAKVIDVNPLWVMGYDVIKDKTAGTVFIESEIQEDQANVNEVLRYSGMLYRAGYILKVSEDFNDLYSLSATDKQTLFGLSVSLDLDEVQEFNTILEGVIGAASKEFLIKKMRTMLNKEDKGDDPDA